MLRRALALLASKLVSLNISAVALHPSSSVLCMHSSAACLQAFSRNNIENADR